MNIKSIRYKHLLFICLFLFGISIFSITLDMLILSLFSLMIFYFSQDAINHRHHSHNSIKVPNYLQPILLFLTVPLGAGSPIIDIAFHKWHHKYPDTPKDFYSMKHNLFAFLLREYDFKKMNINKIELFKETSHLRKDKYMNFLHDYSNFIFLLLLFTLMLINFNLGISVIVIPFLYHNIITNTIMHNLQHQKIFIDYFSKFVSYISFGLYTDHVYHHKNSSDPKVHKVDLFGHIYQKIGWSCY